MRDLTEIFSDHFTAPINGKRYEVKPPSAKDGIMMRLDMQKPESEIAYAKWINILFGGDELSDDVAPSGGLWDEFDADGVSVNYATHFGMTAIAYYAFGPEVAETFWESLGKEVTPVEAPTT